MLVDLKTPNVNELKENDILINRGGKIIPISFNELIKENNKRIAMLENKVAECTKVINEQKEEIKEYKQKIKGMITSFIQAFIFNKKEVGENEKNNE